MTEELVHFDGKGRGDKGPRTALLAFTRMELKIFRSLLAGAKDGSPILGGLTRVASTPDLILAGPILGAPQAGMVLEILGRRGVESFFSLGWCGSLTPALKWGDVVLPESAFSEEGTSAHYPLEDGPAGADPDLAEKLAYGLNRKGIPFTRGPVWTTDAPYRETRDKVRAMSEKGLLAVDMESSAIMTVARFRGLQWAGLMVVSDELWGEKWRPGFDSVELKNGLEKCAVTILDTASTQEAEGDASGSAASLINQNPEKT